MSTNPYESPTPFGEQRPTFPPGYPAGPPQRPTSATVFGILHLIFGIMGICGLGMSAMMFFLPFDPQMVKTNPVLQLMQENTFYRLFNQIALVFGFGATLVLIVAGVGLLQQKPFGRTLSIGYGIYGIVAGVLGLLVNALLVFPLLAERMNAAGGGPEQAGAIGGMVGGVCGGVLGFIYPGLVLYFMYQPNVVAAYRGNTISAAKA